MTFNGGISYHWQIEHFVKIRQDQTECQHKPNILWPGGQWYMFNREMTMYIQHIEQPDPRIFDSVWTCNHCGLHFGCAVPKRAAIAHVRDL
jgi:hypothetical protein